MNDGLQSVNDTDQQALDWRVVDRELRIISRQRSRLDAEEARWLREAERVRVWEPLGMVNAIDYLQRRLGYAPHTAKERLRVARELGSLPLLTEALSGGMPYSVVRELTRVLTADTEQAWLDATHGKLAHEVQRMVAGHKRGSLPSDPPDSDERTHRVRLELQGNAYARWRQMCSLLGNEVGTPLTRSVDDDELAIAIAEAVLDRRGADAEPTGRAKFQIALSVCPHCDHATQEGGGGQFPVDHTTLARARCDAQHIGSLDGDGPERASQDIPPSVTLALSIPNTPARRL